jgi:HlyD family secretion protein
MASFLSKKFLIYTGIIVILIVAGYLYFNRDSAKEMAVVSRSDVVQEVAATGRVKPEQSVDLGFDKSGRVREAYVSVGDKVKRGQMIAVLEAGEISADLARARAVLAEENVKLREMKNTAPSTYNDASVNLGASIREAFAASDNAIRNRADQFFKNIPANPQFEISITSGNFIHYFNVPSNTVLEINNGRKEAEVILLNWQQRLPNISTANAISEADRVLNELRVISSFLDKMAGAVNSFSSVDFAYDTTVSSYKTAIAAARTEVAGAVSSIVMAKEKLNSAPTPGDGGQFESILAQEAKVSQAAAAVSSMEASLAKSSIIAPFDGIVTLQDARPGAAVSPGSSLVSLISQNDMYIEANISEIHIGRMMPGNPVSVVFDAFPTENFQGEVAYIEPGDILVEGVVNYKIRVSLPDGDPRIKSGLTANLKIQTSKRDNVLSLPLYTVMQDNGRSYVNKITEDGVLETPVDLGLRGSNGKVEILSGVTEGDSVEF